ncbi:hypothetical protein QEN19_000401 [Hanseniaspora menglaensis]
MIKPIQLVSLVLAAGFSSFINAMTLDISGNSSICQDTALIQQGILDYYSGDGVFQDPYYWWEGGLAFGLMIENTFLCQNTTFNSKLQDALIAQSGTSWDFMPESQTMVEGNDDQGVWGLTLMTAAERNFSRAANGTESRKNIPEWVTMAQSIYNTMYARWDTSSCGGGLRWQIYTWNNGYNYKNTIANGCLFNLAARLGRYFNNQTYMDQAEEIFTWLVDVDFINLNGSSAKVYDGATTTSNCSDITALEWSYNYGTILGGAAYMYDATNQSSVWESRVNDLWEGTSSTFFNSDGIMYEQQCQASKTCNNDQRCFKSLLSMMLEYTYLLVPTLKDDIYDKLTTSAKAAAGSCDGGYDGHTCGMNWFTSTNDGYYGLGEQMSALGAIQSLLGSSRPDLYKESTNEYMAKGDATAGTATSSSSNEEALLENQLDVTKGDKVGAAFLTAVVLSILIAGSVSMLF